MAQKNSLDTKPGFRRRALLRGLATAAASTFVASGKDFKHVAPKRSTDISATYSKGVVETVQGKVRGYTNRGVLVFRGIPYAAPTRGANRFMPPQKPASWKGIRSCLTYGPGCPVNAALINEQGDNSPRGDEDNFLLYRIRGWRRAEDCLRLNVCTPATASPNRKRAVMVYMHGGGYTGGSGNDLLCYDGENLARHHDVVVVTHNHRLNVFGYLNLAEFGGERYAASGNVGMLDNVAVLEWVRDNIASFGGDPENVLIFGQSGGGGKVSHLMAMPSAAGLFHRVAVQSGATLRTGSADKSNQLAAALLAELAVSKSQIDKLHSIPASALLAAQAAAVNRLKGEAWGPFLDGKIIPAHPFDPSAPAISANVPLLIGNCQNEFVNGCDNPEVATLTEADLKKRVGEAHGAPADNIIEAYRREYPQESPFGIWAAISASAMHRNSITQAERKAAQGAAPAYHYLYAWRTPMLDNTPGTFHSSEITFAFDNADLCTQYSGGGQEALGLSYKMGEAWASFARSGRPGHKDLPEWPSYNRESRATMVFNNQCAIKNDIEGAGLRLMKDA